MDHIVKTSPTHVRTLTGERLDVYNAGNNLQFGLEMPHFLKARTGEASMIIPSDMRLHDGNMIQNEHGREFFVTEVVERRKARGDWSKNPFDSAPDWARVKYL